ncbi:MAG: RluA family pseudouridine synthase [Blautia sp.]|nr:RluA family pseudouridine synthase [Blautia sp.]
MKTKIIYEDNALLVVQKPAGLAAQTAKAGQADVVSELKNYLRNPYLGVVHRLDQPVEGLLVFAKNKEAAAALSAQLADGTLNKRYYGLICGKPVKEQGELVDYLYKETQNGGHAVVVEEQERSHFPAAKKAVLQYRLVQYAEKTDLSLMEIHIDTGRFHQIRAQMAHAGMALLGDIRYGDEAAREKGRELNIRNVALCAYEIAFLHPVKKQEMRFRIKPEGKVFAYFKDFLPY